MDGVCRVGVVFANDWVCANVAGGAERAAVATRPCAANRRKPNGCESRGSKPNPARQCAESSSSEHAVECSAPANSGANSLSLKDAEALAIKNNPQISVARLTALASQQVTREVRSNLWPTVTGNITGVDAESGSRITAGALNNPIIYERAAAGVMVSQLITDFGRTTNLISSANYAAKAENENAVATKEQILLAVNQAFFNALQAQAVLSGCAADGEGTPDRS